MKKLIYIIIIYSILLCSCTDPSDNDSKKHITDITEDIIVNEVDIINENTIDITSELLGIGGDYDALAVKYCSFASGYINIPNTITDSRSTNYIDFSNMVYEYEKMYKTNDGTFISERPPILYYIVNQLKISDEYLNQYIEGLKINDFSKDIYIPNNAVEALLSEDINYAKRILKSPLALYADGNIYNTYELLDMDKDSIAKLNISQEEMESYQKNINEYFELHKEYFVNEDSYYGKFKNEVIDFLEQDIIFEILN